MRVLVRYLDDTVLVGALLLDAQRADSGPT